VQAEQKAFDRVLNNPDRPYVVVLGGSKVSDKIGVINNLITMYNSLDCGRMIKIERMCINLYILPYKTGNYNEKIKILQLFCRRNYRYFKFNNYIKSDEFNEWLYHPDKIGGKMAVKRCYNRIK
jgi:hypothetical protein